MVLKVFHMRESLTLSNTAYAYSFGRQRWKSIPPVTVDADVPIPIDLTAGPRGRLPDLSTHNRYQGALIRTVGTVCGTMNDGRENRCFYMDAGSSRIPVDCSCFPRILEDDLIGCTVEVTGRCQLEMSSQDPQAPFPEITGMSIIIGHQGNVRILARPSWLTPTRLLVAIAFLLAALVAFFAWNRILTRIVTVRSRQLYKAELAQAKSRLRIDERTRLAVELHDTLAQNLTGISLEVQAARAQLNKRPEQTDAHLALAGKSLESCRRELRNCLRDLRNDALEQADMDKAIRMTLEPHVENTRVSVRFNVPRARLSDNTAHAILRIVRELVLNALRHGKATSVRVAGTLDGSRVSFSVRDDGCGFDPDRHPGAREGHFGLVGIRERVKAFDGKLEIDSRPGGGTKVAVTLHLPHEQDKHEENKDIHR